jgi:Mrp family chromosome partitioning ATPase
MTLTDRDDLTSDMQRCAPEKLFQGAWEGSASLNRPGGITGTAVEELLSCSPTALQIGLDSSSQEFSQLFATIESRTAAANREGDAVHSRHGHILGVTSAVVGEGKTTVALHLAMSAARNTNSKVCLIDLGLTGESVLQRLGAVAQGSGIIDALEGTNQTFPMWRIRDFEELTIIPAGKTPANPARIARSPRLEEALESARRMFDLILIDMPAISTHNARPMVEYMDGLVMIARAGVTPQDVITNAMDHIGREKVLGVVLNRVRFSGPRWLQKRLMQR